MDDRDLDAHQELVQRAHRVGDAVGRVEVGDAYRAGTARADEHERGRERDQRRRGVVGRRRDAALSTGYDVADEPFLLQTAAQRTSPEAGLIDVAAARIETDVSPQRAHATVVRAADRRSRLREPRGDLAHHPAGLQRVQRGTGAEHQDAVLDTDVPQGRDALDRDEVPRGEQPLLHVRKQIGPTRDDAGVLAQLGEERHGVRDRVRGVEPEGGQRQHVRHPSR